MYVASTDSTESFQRYSLNKLQSRDTTIAPIQIDFDEPEFTDSVLVALYRAERCYLIGIESERMIDRLYELWRVEYLLRVQSIKQGENYRKQFERAEQERVNEQQIGLDYAESFGKEQRRKKAWRKLSVYGVPVAFGAGLIIGVLADK